MKYEIKARHSSIHNRSEPVKFVFSACLFGKESPELEKYYIQPFLENVDRIHMRMPEAQARLYVAQSLQHLVVPRLVERGVDVHVVSPDSMGFEGSLWRLFPADEELPFMSIDMDSDVVVNSDLVNMIRHWLNDSSKPFFLLRQMWSSLLPITAGRFGAKPHTLPFNVKERIETYCDTNFGIDEAFLNLELWPHVKNHIDYDTTITGAEAGIIAGLMVLAGLIATSLYWSYNACMPETSSSSSSYKSSRKKHSEQYPLGW
jgi:hypothetical protein